MPLALNLVAVFVGALFGGLRATKDPDVDVVGIFTLALCMGFGGGLVRDLLLGNLPPAALRTPAYLLVVVAATVVGIVFVAQLPRLDRILAVLDSLSVGLFAAVGTNASLLAGLTVVPAVFIGTIASVGGLILAEFLQATPSTLLHTGPPNALAGLAAAIGYAATSHVLGAAGATVLAVALTMAIRLIASRRDLHTPSVLDLQAHLRPRPRARPRHRG